MHLARHSLLLTTLVLLFAVVPFVDEGPQRRGILVEVLFLAVLLGGVYDLSGRRQTLVIGLCLAVPAILVGMLGIATSSEALRIAGRALFGAALAYQIYVLVARLLEARRVNFDTISAAVSGYLVLGLLWTVLFGLLLAADRACIRGVPADHATSAVVYFSFTTLTTLGYGDMAAVTPLARSVAILEAIVGQLYLTIMIARLIGIQIAGPATPRPPTSESA